MVNNIIYVLDTPITEFHLKYYEIDIIKKCNINVVFFDISYLINKRAYYEMKNGTLDYTINHVFLIKDYIEFEKRLLNYSNKDTIIIDSGSYDYYHRTHYKIISKNGFDYGYFVLNSCFENGTRQNGFKRIIGFLKNLSLNKLKNSIYIRLPKIVNRVKSCLFVIINSKVEIENYKKKYYCDENTKFLILHSRVLEEMIDMKKTKNDIPYKYCVWLDSYIPYHPDLAQLNNVKIDPDKYYSSLRNFFGAIEKNYNVKVIVSAHPKSDYVKHNDAYCGFEIRKNQTCNLIKFSEFVLTAASTSFMYAVGYEKPLIFIEQDELIYNLPTHIKLIELLANELGATIINIDSENYIFEYPLSINIDRERYLSVASKYLKDDYSFNEDYFSYYDILSKFFLDLK